MPGGLSDKFGRKTVLIPSLLPFGVARGACALARDFELLLLQGVGAAALGATNVTLIGDLFAGHERTAALGHNSSVLSTGTATYPAICGALATFGWYYPFALPLLAIPIAFLVLLLAAQPRAARRAGPQGVRAEHLGQRQEQDGAGLFAGSLVTFVLLFGSLIVYLPILMDQTFGASPLVIGGVVASTSLTTAFTSTQIGRLSSRFSEKTLVRASFVLYAVALALVAFVPCWWLLFLPTVIFGVAQSLNLPNVFSLLNEAAPDENRGAFLALNSTILRLGQTLGPVLMAVAAASLSLTGAYLAAGTLAAAIFVAALVLIR